jgi:histidine triad (HIT) family protein
MKQKDDCIFCKIAKGEIPSEKLSENDSCFSIMDKNQNIKGHALVISKHHAETILDTPNTLGPELIECIKETGIKIMKDFNATGFNVVQNNFKSSGQEIPHLHFHILPRTDDDKLGTWF